MVDERRIKGIAATLLSDGSSDAVLVEPLCWMARIYGFELFVSIADLRKLRNPPRALYERMKSAVDLYPCDVLMVHRDAERESYDSRCEEIRDAARRASLSALPVVPVRMTEAWLLFDEPAIRKAAGNPNGREALDLPPLHQCESLPNPKEELHRALLSACGLSGRRLAKFKEQEVKRAVHLVSRYVDSFEP